MFRSRKTDKEYISLNESFKDWKDASPEIECLGRQLDAVRRTLDYLKERPENHWAVIQWRQTEAILLRKWKMMVSLQSCGLRQMGPSRTIPIDYDWFEKSNEASVSLPFFDGICYWIQDRFGLPSGSLDRAWEMAREEKLQKARQGLA
jgi:hypothetical protein